MNKVIRPSFVTDEHLDYLDDLRKSGSVNMFDAAIGIRHQGATLQQTKEILGYWGASYSERQRSK